MTRRGFVPWLGGGALVVLLVGAAGRAEAQGVLGRARDRARQLIGGNAPARQACTGTVTVTGDVVPRYIRALQAREAELQRLAGDNSRTGRYFAAVLRQDSAERRKNDFEAGTGPDYDRYQALMARIQSGDQSAVQPMTALRQDLDRRVDLPSDADWNAVRTANARMDTVMSQGGGFSLCEWQSLQESIAGAAAQLARDPSADVAPTAAGGALGPDAVQAIRANRVELARLLKLSYKSDAMIAREQAERARQDSLNTAMAAWTACRQRVMGATGSPAGATASVPPDSLRVWQAQIADAQKRGDQATVMAIAMKIQGAMMPGMMQQGMAAAQANQQCGPMPGTPRQ